MDEQANLAAQRDLYGEPLADVARRIMTTLGLTQGRLADALQLSAPMLSQLMSGHRVKIGNPAVVHRLQSLARLAEQADALDSAEVTTRIAEIRAEGATITGLRAKVSDGSGHAVEALRAAAPVHELARLAATTSAPALAVLLRAAAEADPERHG